MPLPRLHSTFQEPIIEIDHAALDSWRHDRLENSDALLTAAITASQNPNHHALASRALIRSRLQDWDAALVDAEMVRVALFPLTPMPTLIEIKAIKIHPSVIGYIAKSIAHIGKGERDRGYQTCDIAFERFHSSHVTFLLLVKVRILKADALRLLILLRPLLCSWLETDSVRYRVWTTLSLQSTSTRSVMQFRRVHNVRSLGECHL